MSSLLPYAAAIVVFMVVAGIFNTISTRKSRVSNRLRLLNDGEEYTASLYEEDEEEAHETILSFDNNRPTGLGAVLAGLLSMVGINWRKAYAENSLLFTQAGFFSPNGLITYLFIKRILGLVLVLIGLLLLINAKALGDGLLFGALGIILIVIGLKGADLYLKNARARRQHLLTRSFPDALDLILVCVESGLALDASLARVCKELKIAHPVMTEELERLRLELSLLNDRERAFNNLADRTDIPPFRALVSALLQSERFGTDLAETLRVLAEDYRHQRLMIAENKAGRLPALITIPLVTLMLPALFLVIMTPAILDVMRTWK